MNRSRKMKWTGNMAGIGYRRGAFSVSVGRNEGKSQLRRLWRFTVKIFIVYTPCGM